MLLFLNVHVIIDLPLYGFLAGLATMPLTQATLALFSRHALAYNSQRQSFFR
jgi:hypothetical protein